MRKLIRSIIYRSASFLIGVLMSLWFILFFVMSFLGTNVEWFFKSGLDVSYRAAMAVWGREVIEYIEYTVKCFKVGC